jgi:hypothetical protein
MNRSLIPSRRTITIILLIAFTGRFAIPAYGDPAIKLHNWQGTIDTAPDGTAAFTLEGTASQLGKFDAYGEIQLVPGQEEGSLLGQGVVVFTAANGDQLVGVTTWDVGPDSIGQLHFSWRDAIELADGTIVSSTGRFLTDRPPGLVIIAIIITIIGLLLPAVQ